MSRSSSSSVYATAFSHHAKPYDYNFDFATDHALVCTELVWRSYRPSEGKKGLKIPLVEIAGRKTLPANEIAKLIPSWILSTSSMPPKKHKKHFSQQRKIFLCPTNASSGVSL
jgi:hypothetical protein